MKSFKIFSLILILAAVAYMATAESSKKENKNSIGSDVRAEAKAQRSKTLVVYFSRTGEQYSVGHIAKGNTAIVADMIAEITGADKFEILPQKDIYPKDNYTKLTQIAKQEKESKSRPKYIGTVTDFGKYDTVFIGYPNWWGDMPMIVYSFLESHDFIGKTVIPFCTHEGSGMSGTDKNIAETISANRVERGFAFYGHEAQNEGERVRSKLKDTLKTYGFNY